MGTKSEQEAIADVREKYAAQIRQAMQWADPVKRLTYLLKQALEDLAFELRPG